MEDEMTHQILKDLVFKYKETKDPKVFIVLLEKIDDLIVHTVKRFSNRHPQYQNVELQDLYHSAIVGLYKGIDSALERERGAVLQARLIAYMKAEMMSFCRKLYEKSRFIEFYKTKDVTVPGDEVYRNLEVKFLRERFQKLIDDEVISPEEYKILVMRFSEKRKVKEIADEMKHSQTWVYQKIKNALIRIRYELGRQGLEEF